MMPSLKMRIIVNILHVSHSRYSHLNTLMAIAYATTPQIASTPSCAPQSASLAPSKATFLIASVRGVRGTILQIGCSHEGKFSIGKNVPAQRNCGRVKRFAKGGIELSFFASPLTTKPKPMNTARPIKLNDSNSKKVTTPCTRVKSNAK